MFKNIVFLLGLTFLFSCAGPAHYTNSNKQATELIVHYNNKEVHRRSTYTSEQKIRDLIRDQQEIIVIFVAEWCESCTLTIDAISQTKLKIKVHYVNIDEEWAAQVAALMKIKTIPIMLHVDTSGKTVATRLGTGQIVTYLLANF